MNAGLHANQLLAQDNPDMGNSPARRLLVVDDNVAAAQIFGMMLDLQGHEHKLAYTGDEAIKLAKEYLPTHIFLDISMPDINGFTLCRLFRSFQELKDTQLIAVTGWSEPQYRRDAKEAGFTHFLVKPVDARTLEELMEIASI